MHFSKVLAFLQGASGLQLFLQRGVFFLAKPVISFVVADLTRDLGLAFCVYGAISLFAVLGKEKVAVFDYTLDADQILEIYNATSTGKTADLSSMATPPVAWYRMGD